jgi:hypothetical protein
MRRKTFLLSAARKIGMDPGNLSRLAEKWGVSIEDEAALTDLGREHQREPAPDSEDVVPVSIAMAEIDLLHDKLRRSRRASILVVQDLLRDMTIFQQQCSDLLEALGPIWKAPWHGSDGLVLTSAQIAAIQDLCGADCADIIGGLRNHRQRDLERLDVLRRFLCSPLGKIRRDATGV